MVDDKIMFFMTGNFIFPLRSEWIYKIYKCQINAPGTH